MSGLTAVYVVFAIVFASMFGYMLLLSRRQRDTELEVEELRDHLAKRGKLQ